MKPEPETNVFDCLPPAGAKLIGVVLIGGKSSRMGIDKAEINYHGIPQWRYLYELLSPLADRTFLSCNARQASEHPRAPSIIDHSAEMGPMGGLLSVFKVFPENALLTVPCDLPFLDRETLGQLIRNRNPGKLATTYWNPDHQTIEPLLTIWEPAAYPVLLRYSQQGLNSPYRVLKNEVVETVPALSSLPFENVNTREEYEAVKKKQGS